MRSALKTRRGMLNKEIITTMLEKFESQVAEYEIRMGGVAKEQ